MSLLFLETKNIMTAWMFPRDIAKLTGFKSATPLLSDFRDFVAKHPNYFTPLKPLVGDEGRSMQYSPLCVMHYKENKDALDAGVRDLNFEEDLARLSKAYQYYMMTIDTEPILEEWEQEMLSRFDELEERIKGWSDELEDKADSQEFKELGADKRCPTCHRCF